MKWFAVQVRTSTEATAARLLRYKGHECFLPVSKSRRRWSDRVKEVQAPLFPGYVFSRIDPQRRLGVLTTPGVLQIVGVGKQPIPVDDTEIAAIQRLEQSGLPAEPCYYVNVGQLARIEQGPLSGLVGIVVGVKSDLRLVLSVTLLQRSVAVEVDRDWLGKPHTTEVVPQDYLTIPLAHNSLADFRKGRALPANDLRAN